MENNIEFKPFPKMARLSRECIITEKIDGTNAQILINENNEIFAGSKNRFITPENDNFGFAKWVLDNKEELLKLGIGQHFGEWWGNGIQHGYNLPKGEKRFSLFNTIRWVEKDPQVRKDDNFGIVKMQEIVPICCKVVPILYKGKFETEIIDQVLQELEFTGSHTVPGFMKPEGIVIYHTAANFCFKKTLNNDAIPKSLIKE